MYCIQNTKNTTEIIVLTLLAYGSYKIPLKAMRLTIYIVHIKVKMVKIIQFYVSSINIKHTPRKYVLLEI
jgi:hypothetical protein